MKIDDLTLEMLQAAMRDREYAVELFGDVPVKTLSVDPKRPTTMLTFLGERRRMSIEIHVPVTAAVVEIVQSGEAVPLRTLDFQIVSYAWG